MAGLGVFAKAARSQWQVARIDAAMLDELMDLRVLLESFALERHFQSAGAPEPFVRLLGAMERLAGRPRLSRSEFFRLDRELHQAILEAGRNRYLAEHFQLVWFPIQLQALHQDFTPERLRLGLGQHIGLLRAIADGDRRLALERLREHLNAARQTLRGLKPSGG